jgi:hypothetical protein
MRIHMDYRPLSVLLITQVRDVAPPATVLPSRVCEKLSLDNREDLLLDLVDLYSTSGPRMSTINNEPPVNDTATKPYKRVDK